VVSGLSGGTAQLTYQCVWAINEKQTSQTPTVTQVETASQIRPLPLWPTAWCSPPSA